MNELPLALQAMLLLQDNHLEWSADFESIKTQLLALSRAYYLEKDLKPTVETLLKGITNGFTE